MKSIFTKSVITILLIMLTGCAANPMRQDGNPDVYSRAQSMSPGRVIEGTILQVRLVKIAASDKYAGVGAVIGGLVGAVASKGKGGAITGLSTLIGAAAGSTIATFAGDSVGEEIVVRLSDGDVRVIVQEKGKRTFAAGESILCLVNGKEVRIV